MKEETQMWLAKAREDFSAARLLLDAGLTDTACYHCHQACEKCIKAILEEHDRRIPRSHDLDALIQQVDSFLREIPDTVRSAATFLSGFGVTIQYPGTDTDLDDAKEAMEMAKVIVGWTDSILVE